MLNRWNKLLSREGVDLTTLSGVDPVFIKTIREFSKSNKEYFFTYFEGKRFTHYIAVDAHGVGKYLYRKYFRTPEQVKKYYQRGLKLRKEIEESSKQWKKRVAGKNKYFRSAFKIFQKQFKEICGIYSIISYLSIESWQRDFEVLLSTLMNQRKLEEVEQEWIRFLLCQPWKKTALLDLKDGLLQGENIKRLVEKYQFLRSWAVVWYRSIDTEWIKRMQPTATGSLQQLYTATQLKKLLKPSKSEWQFLTLAPYIIFFKDWRDDVRRFHAYAWAFLFEELGKQFHCHPFDLGYLTLEEVEESISTGKLPVEKIVQRKNSPFVLTGNGSNLKIFVTDIPQRYKKIREHVENSRETNMVSGVIAQKGTAVGEVIIINSFHDIKKVGEGQILVANTTHPDYLPAMQRAAAFVTNEGGVISHAAIVAREMKKPCIVNTKFATKVFQNGDRVEVDAERGIVRKLI